MTGLTLDNIAAIVKLTLARGEIKPDALLGLVDTCRRLGALDDLRRLIHASNSLDQEDRRLSAIRRIVEARPPLEATPDESLPTPFLIRDGLLPQHDHRALQELTKSGMKHFTSSHVQDIDYSGVNLQTRRSMILRDVASVRELFMPHLQAMLREQDIQNLLGVDQTHSDMIELQVTCHGDGAFFKPHTDSGKAANSSRKVSFVYYYHFSPKRFSGGDLKLFDGSPVDGRWSTGAFTRVSPLNNRIVLFPSQWTHEVEPVFQTAPDWEGSRFSVNGWIH